MQDQKSIAYSDVLERIADDAIGKQDYTSPMNNLHMDDKGYLAFINANYVDATTEIKDIPFTMTDWAESQAYTKLGMPAQYFKKVKDIDPELVAQHFNYWAGKSNNSVMLRTRVRNNDAGVIRGMVSDKYSILDNDFTANILGNILKGQESHFSIVQFNMDDKLMHIRMAYVDTTEQIGVTRDGRPDYMQLGTDNMNSEVGFSSYNLIDMIYRKVCANGLRAWTNNGEPFVQRHIFLKDYEFQGRVVAAMIGSFKSGQGLLEEFKKTMEVKIENPFKVIERLAKQGNLSQDFTDNAKNSWEGDKTAYSMINSLTSAARDLPFDRRLDAEEYAGSLIRLSPGQWRKIDEEEDTLDK
jgi:hypothetical protein